MVAAAASGITVGNIGIDKKSGSLKVEGMSVAGFDTGKVMEAVQAGIDAEKIRPQKEIDTKENAKNASAEIQLAAMNYVDRLRALQGANVIETKSGAFGVPHPVYGNRADGHPASESFALTLSAGAPEQSLDIAVMKLAEQDSVKSTTATADTTSPLGLTGTLVFPHKDGTSAPITVTIDPTDTAISLRNKLNAVKSSTDVSAVLIPSGTGYKIELVASSFSKPLTFTKTITGGDETLFPNSSTRTREDLQLQLQINGETSRYDTNTATVKTMGFTLQAFEPTQAAGLPAAPAHVNCVQNTLAVVDSIQAWVEARNDLTKVMDKYTSLDLDSLNLSPEEKKDFTVGLLTTNSQIMELDNHLRFSLQKSVGGMTLGKMGITLEKGVLDLNLKTLNEVVSNSFNDVKNFFTYNESSTNPQFQSLTHPDALPASVTNTNVTVTTYNNGGTLGASFVINGVATPIQATSVTVDGTGLKITAPDDSPLKGFSFYFDGTLAAGQSASSVMQFSQGVGDSSIQYFERAFGENGLFAQLQNSLDKEIMTQKERIDRIDQAGQHKLEMLQKRLEAAVQAISAIMSIVNQVRAMTQIETAAAMA